jgi:hypothetical protein
MARKERGKITTIVDAYERYKPPTTTITRPYEMFRRKVRRLEAGNVATILNLARAAGLIDENYGPIEFGEENMERNAQSQD